jgi:hypothetical protein
MRGGDHYQQAHQILGSIEASLAIKVAEVHALLALMETLMEKEPAVSVAHGTVLVGSRDNC